MKYAIVILDGAAGWSLPEHGGRTTLELAHTPHLDALATTGVVGCVRTVPAGLEPSSSSACLSILGYDPVTDHVGRGAIEAAARGIALAADEVALRVNLVTVEDGRMASYCAGHITSEESRAIVAELAAVLDGETFSLHSGVAYRHILVVKGHPELLEAVYPAPHDIAGEPIAARLPAGPGSALLRSYGARARELLGHSEVNARRRAAGKRPATDVWPFWPGAAPRALEPFGGRWGVRAAMTSGVDLLGGLAALTGIERLEVAGVTAGADSDHSAQAAAAVRALDDRDLVVVHVEAPDEAGHAGDVAGKVAAIEAIDRDIVAVLREIGEARILAMPDHPTPIALRTHTGEPVPFVLAGPGICADAARAFSERAAEETGLFVDPGHTLMDKLLG